MNFGSVTSTSPNMVDGTLDFKQTENKNIRYFILVLLLPESQNNPQMCQDGRVTNIKSLCLGLLCVSPRQSELWAEVKRPAASGSETDRKLAILAFLWWPPSVRSASFIGALDYSTMYLAALSDCRTANHGDKLVGKHQTFLPTKR